MNITYDTALTEVVVHQEIERREKKGDMSLLNEYHDKADPIYEIDPSDREEEFEKVHEDIFLSLGYGKVINEAIEEFPSLKDKIGGIYVAKSLVAEEADIMKKGFDDEEDSLPKIKLKIRAEMFNSPDELRNVLRHEFMHIIDMLDENFGYEAKLPPMGKVEENFIRERYKILWDIYIDSRLIRQEKKAVASRDQRFAEFSVIYKKIPQEQSKVMFDNLWARESMTHKEIMNMAMDMMQLVGAVGDATAVEIVEEKRKANKPGAPCPLCQFPTYKWAKEFDPDDENAKKVHKAIQVDFPKWQPQDGICERCEELYKWNL